MISFFFSVQLCAIVLMGWSLRLRILYETTDDARKEDFQRINGSVQKEASKFWKKQLSNCSGQPILRAVNC